MTLASSVHPALTLVFLERERTFRLCNKGTGREAVVWGDTRARFSFTHLQICTCVGQAVRAKRGGRSRTVRLLTRLKGLSCQGVERWRYAKRARTITGRTGLGTSVLMFFETTPYLVHHRTAGGLVLPAFVGMLQLFPR